MAASTKSDAIGGSSGKGGSSATGTGSDSGEAGNAGEAADDHDVPEGECVPGAKQSDDLVLQTCDAEGSWQSGDECEFACDDGECTGASRPSPAFDVA